MLVAKKISKKKIVFLGLLMAVIGGLIIYLIFSNFFREGLAIIPLKEEGSSRANTPSLKIDFPADFLNSAPYRNLNKSSNFSVSAGPQGRDNPFIPLLFVLPEATR